MGEQARPIDIMAVNDKAFDLIAEIAVQEEMEAALAEMEAADLAGVSVEEETALQRLDAKYRSQIDKHFRKENIQRFFKRTLPRFGQIAAVFIAIISIAGTAAFAASPFFRAKVMQLIYTLENEDTHIALRENDAASFDVPAEWKDDYFPSFVPDGLHIKQVIAEPFESSKDSIILWADSEGDNRLSFSTHGEGAETVADTEDAEVEPFEYGNFKDGLWITEADRITKEDRITVVWRIFDRYYILTSFGLSKDVTMKVIEGIQKIR